MEGNKRKAECKKKKLCCKFEGLTLRTRPQTGITLIALIITIIVMLILVGVTINVVLNGGLFTQAQIAAKDTQKEADKEQLLSAVVAAIGTNAKVDFNKLDSNLPSGWTGSNGTYTSPNGNTFTVDENGTIDPPTSSYEYTLAEIIEIAKNSSTAMYMDEKEENEDYVEGEPYELIVMIPFSEFWKEGTPDSVKNGTESANRDFDYEYIVTVENFPYIEIKDDFEVNEDTRGLIFVGMTPEHAEDTSHPQTTENWIYVDVAGLTAEDDLEQIKIKIQEPEPEPEFNEFRLGDLVNVGTETLVNDGSDETTYFHIPVAEFNNIIGQDITTLGDYYMESAGTANMRIR